MATYEITVPIVEATGVTTYHVTGDMSPDEALDAWQRGEAEVVDEQIDVLEPGKPQIRRIG